jgi:hypothetical protein
MMRALAGGVLVACCMALAAPVAEAEVLLEQRPGPAAVEVPSQLVEAETERSSEAADDFVVPARQNWQLSEVHAFGASAAPGDRHFDVTIYEGTTTNREESGRTFQTPYRAIFAAHDIAATGAGDYSIPLANLPLLDEGTYWIAIAARATGSADAWSWLGSPPGAGAPAAWHRFSAGDCFYLWRERSGCVPGTAAEPNQAFVLEGAREQILATGFYGESGRVVSSPPGIDCPGTCKAAFPRGTVVTLTGLPLLKHSEFASWRRGPPPDLKFGPPVAPDPAELPCAATAPCTFALNEDLTIYGTYRPASWFLIGRLKRDRGDGTAKLLLRFPRSGAFTLGGGGVVAFHTPSQTFGLVRVPIVPKGAAAAQLRRTGRSRVTLRLRFRTEGGVAKTVVRRVTLLRRVSKPAHRVH